jgi:hypothetical protein
VIIFLAILSGYTLKGEDSSGFYTRGAFYLDWFGTRYEGSSFINQFSARLKADLINRPGTGWSLTLDTRDRLRVGEASRNKVILYDARLNFEKPESPIFLSLGWMNLYDTAGIGHLFGGVFGYKPLSDLMVGVYAGLESGIYVDRLKTDYQKFGFFTRYLGKKGRRMSFSYNHIRYSGETERQYLYSSVMFPVRKYISIYGNVEYELASNVRQEDRLSRIFINARIDPLRFLDLTAFYSSGRGLDYHRYMLEASQDPVLNDRKLELYYYSRYFGLRMSVKPIKGIRIYAARQQSEQKTLDIQNHVWRFGGSASNILGSGLTLYGNYSIKRGEMSEADSYFVALSRVFGKFSVNLDFSNTYNGVRFDTISGTAEVIHMDDYKTIAASVFYPFNRRIACSVEYEYFLQEQSNQHLFFIRLIFRL